MSAIQYIGTEHAPQVAHRSPRATELPSQPASSGNNRPEYIVELSSGAVNEADVRKSHDSLNTAAKSIRTAAETMGQANDYIEKMKANLNRIVKNYPPFPPGSEERVRMLRSFNAFRQLIDRLSSMPEEHSPAGSRQDE